MTDLVSRKAVLQLIDEHRRAVPEQSLQWYVLNHVWRDVDRLQRQGRPRIVDSETMVYVLDHSQSLRQAAQRLGVRHRTIQARKDPEVRAACLRLKERTVAR